ncbi:MAG: DUF1835 domain-containing protein [Pyrinomonadaceae bacterium]
MIYHVLPGDSLVEEFKKTDIVGEVIVCRECLVAGDLTGETPDEFWQVRANFLSLEYDGDPIEYQENVAYELERLIGLPADAEVNLWFEYELFCASNMWFCLDLLKNTEAKVFRVAPLNASPDDVWKGFGQHNAEQLGECFEARVQFTDEDLATGAKLWNAFRKRDSDKLLELGEFRSPSFPFLQEVCDAEAEIDKRPAEIMKEIKNAGFTEIETAFPEFQKRAGVYGFGDLQVANLLARS